MARKPDRSSGFDFTDLFDLDEIQKIQDSFAMATGVASLITTVDGRAITKPSNLRRLCMDIIRKTDDGFIDCRHADAVLGRYNPHGPTIQPCPCGGLWDGSASISVGSRHIANWLIGQVRDETTDTKEIIKYARRIGADEEAFRSALAEVPAMSFEQFEQVCQALFLMANHMSKTAFQNTRLTRLISERKKMEEKSRLDETRLEALLELNHMTDSTFQEIADFTLEEAVKLTRSTMGCVALLNDDESVMTLLSRTGISSSGHEMTHAPMELEIAKLGLLGESVRQRRPFISNDCKASGHEKKAYPEDRVEITRYLNAPLVENTKIVAVIAVGNKGGRYDFSDITQLTLLMDGMWKIIQRRGAEVELKKHRDHLEELVMERTVALQENETRFRALIEKSADIILVVNREGVFSYASPSAVQFGYRLEGDVRKSRPLDYVHPEDLSRAETYLKMSMNRPNETVGINDIRIRRRDGSHRWLSGMLTCLFDQPGVNGLVMNLRDVTESKRAEVALKRSEERFRDVALSSSDWIWEMDARGNFTYAGGKVQEVIGWRPEEIIGKTLFDFMPEKEAEKKREAWLETAARKAEVHDYENWCVHKDGHLVCLQSNGVPILDENGRLLGYRGLDKDVTMRVEAREALTMARDLAESANEIKSDFLKNMSHEFRTPMNAIVGMNALLLETRLTKTQREYARLVAVSAKSLLDLVNDLFDFSEADAKRMGLEIIDFNIQTTLEGVADAILLKTFEKGLAFVSEVDADVPSFLRGDPGRLRQALMNYANNAVKFTKRGKVEIRVEREGELENSVLLRFTVADTGVGIPENRVDDIFESFTQSDASTTRAYGGAGLGLAITRQIVALMNGDVGVDSVEGAGSTFWFTAVFEKQTEVRQKEIAPLADPRGKRILIVDDHAADRGLLRRILLSLSCRVDEANDGPLALEKLHRARFEDDPYDAAILDMTTPGMNGEELGRAIKEDVSLSGVILIMLTGYGRRGDAARLKRIGFAGYLIKPVMHGEMYECLVMVLSHAEGEEDAPFVTRYTLAEHRGAGARILLAEDNRTNRIVARGILKKLGCKVDVAVNGQEAVDALRTRGYDLVLMDCQMPVLDGCSATREIREMEKHATPPGPGIPVIAMTANVLESNRQKCLDAGMNDFIPKPVDPKKLSTTIMKWIAPPISSPPEASAADGSAEQEKTREPPDDEGKLPGVEDGSDKARDAKKKSAIFDREGLIHRMMDDEELAREVVGEFLDYASEYIKVLEKALEKRDAPMLRREAHTLKGAAGNAGANVLQEMAYETQLAAEAEDLDQAASLFPRIQHQLHAFRKELEQMEWI